MSTIRIEARRAGFFYLAFILFTFAADTFAVFTQNDAALIDEKIRNGGRLIALGLVSHLFSALFFLLAAWGLYVLLKRVDGNLALLLLILNSIGVSIQVFSVVSLIVLRHLSFLSTDSVLPGAGFNGMVQLYSDGFLSAQLFYSAWLFPLGILIRRSGFLPSFLGSLLIVDGVAIFIWFLQNFLFPEIKFLTALCLLISLAAELGLTAILLMTGLGMNKPNTEESGLIRKD